MLTPRQTQLLRQARNLIERNPAKYNQTSFGIGAVDCATPGCIAAHIVAAEPALARQAGLDLGEMDANSAADREVAGDYISKMAQRALGVSRRPQLFYSEWPATWQPGPESADRGTETDWIPSADDAVRVLDEILAGNITNALPDSDDR